MICLLRFWGKNSVQCKDCLWNISLPKTTKLNGSITSASDVASSGNSVQLAQAGGGGGGAAWKKERGGRGGRKTPQPVVVSRLNWGGCHFWFLRQNTWCAECRDGSAQLWLVLEGHGRCSVLKHGCLQHCKRSKQSNLKSPPAINLEMLTLCKHTHF